MSASLGRRALREGLVDCQLDVVHLSGCFTDAAVLAADRSDISLGCDPIDVEGKDIAPPVAIRGGIGWIGFVGGRILGLR